MECRAADIIDLIAGASWRVAPSDRSRVNGASIDALTLRADDMVFVRAGVGDFGITPEKLKAKGWQPPLTIGSPTARSLGQAQAVLAVPDQ